MMNPSTSAFMLRINAFARDLGAYSIAKDCLSQNERLQVESDLRQEFEYLLRLDPAVLKVMEQDANFGA